MNRRGFFASLLGGVVAVPRKRFAGEASRVCPVCGSVRIRVTGDQKDALTKAATKAGLDVSGWLRSIALREAARAS